MTAQTFTLNESAATDVRWQSSSAGLARWLCRQIQHRAGCTQETAIALLAMDLRCSTNHIRRIVDDRRKTESPLRDKMVALVFKELGKEKARAHNLMAQFMARGLRADDDEVLALQRHLLDYAAGLGAILEGQGK